MSDTERERILRWLTKNGKRIADEMFRDSGLFYEEEETENTQKKSSCQTQPTSRRKGITAIISTLSHTWGNRASEEPKFWFYPGGFYGYLFELVSSAVAIIGLVLALYVIIFGGP